MVSACDVTQFCLSSATVGYVKLCTYLINWIWLVDNSLKSVSEKVIFKNLRQSIKVHIPITQEMIKEKEKLNHLSVLSSIFFKRSALT